MGDNGAMSSDDDVVRLNREGVSIRAIAERLGLSESRGGCAGDQDTNPRLDVRQQAVWRFI